MLGRHGIASSLLLQESEKFNTCTAFNCCNLNGLNFCFFLLRTATEDVLMEPHRMVFVHEGVRALNEVGLEVVLKKKQKQEKMGKTGETGVDFNSGWCC